MISGMERPATSTCRTSKPVAVVVSLREFKDGGRKIAL